jgi:hypothetical protein
MPLDQARIGQVVTAQMEALERDYGTDDDVEIGTVITIVEVLRREGDGYRSDIRTRFNVGDPYRVIGVMRTAEQQIMPTLGAGE